MSNSNTAVLSPIAGASVALADIQDPVFASGAMGVGLGVVPGDTGAAGVIASPLAGTIVACMPHAYGIQSADGVEVLVHIGIDTVKLDGLHFASATAEGAQVAAGTPLTTVDFPALVADGYDPTVVVLVTNAFELPAVTPAQPGPVAAGAPVITLE